MTQEMPWFPFYTDRFLGSRRVRRMTAEQVGIYILLLAEQWSDGPVPDEDGVLEFIGKVDAEVVREVLALCFTLTPDGWVNAPLEEVRAAQEEKRSKRVRAGKAGARARWQPDGNANGNAMTTASDRQCDRNADPMAIEREKEKKKREEERRRDAPEQPEVHRELSEWLTEDYNHALPDLSLYTQRAIYGLVGPTGTRTDVWGSIEPERWPPLTKSAIDSYLAAKGGDAWHQGFFLSIVEGGVRSARKPPPDSEGGRWTADAEAEHYRKQGQGRTTAGGLSRAPVVPTCSECGGILVRDICPACNPPQLVRDDQGVA